MPRAVLDPGHGQYGNKGVLGYYEGTQMWYLGQYLMTELRSLGWEIKNTRPKITDDPALEWRGQQAKGYDLFISLHSNAPGPSAVNYSSIRGAAIYDSVADKLDYLEIPLVAEIAKIMNTPNNGVKHRWNTRTDRQGQDYYGVLRNATTVAGCPDAMLIEHGYHTNPEDAKWLLNHDNLKRLAKAEAILIDRLWRAKHGDDEMILEQGAKGQAVYNYQMLVKKLGEDIGTYKDMVLKDSSGNSLRTGCDGVFGLKMISVTNGLNTKYKLPTSATGVVTDELMGKLNLALQALETGADQSEYDALKKQIVDLKKDISLLNQKIKEQEGAMSEIASQIRGIILWANKN